MGLSGLQMCPYSPQQLCEHNVNKSNTVCLYWCSTNTLSRLGFFFKSVLRPRLFYPSIVLIDYVEISIFTIFENSLIHNDETASTKLPHQQRHVDGPDPITRPHRPHGQSGHRGIQSTVRLGPTCGELLLILRSLIIIEDDCNNQLFLFSSKYQIGFLFC